MDLNLVSGALGSAVGSVGTLIMLIPFDIIALADGTRRNISLDASVF